MNTVTVERNESLRRWHATFRFDYATKDVVKAAGFRFDGNLKVWYTTDPAIAAKLATPEQQAAMAAEYAAAEERKAVSIVASRATNANLDVPSPEGLAYMPFQRAGIAYALARPNTLFGDEMGLGKTIQALGVVNASPDVRNVLVICPASLKLNWKREAERWLTRPADIRIYPLPKSNGNGYGGLFGTQAQKADLVIRIINYDIIGKWPDLTEMVHDVLIVDECHYLKNPKAQRTQAVLGNRQLKQAGIEAKRKLFMSGTPIVNRPIELWPLVEALDPDGLGKNFFAFARRYAQATSNGYGWDFHGAANLEELQDKLRAAIMVRRLKKDVLSELPPKTRQVVEIPAGPLAGLVDAEALALEDDEDYLDSLRAEVSLAQAGDSDGSYESAVARLRDAARISFEKISKLRHQLALAKLPFVIDHITDLLDSVDKVVVFCWHQDVVQRIADEFNAARIDGSTDVASRQAQVDRFQNDPNCHVFVGTIKAAGVGFTLTAANTVVFAELWWVPGDITQAEDRLHRIGQRDNVLVQHLVVEGSLDCRLAKVMVEKQNVIDRALDALAVKAAAAPVTPGETAGRQVTRKDLDTYGGRLTEADIKMLHWALRSLASADCDHASERNGVGFGQADTRVGHSLADAPSLTPRQAGLAVKILVKYHAQLPDEVNALVRRAMEKEGK